MDNDKKKVFTIFRMKLDHAYAQFCVWRTLNNQKYNLTFNMNKYYWTAVLDGLNNSFMSELAKLLEKPDNRFGDTISIFYLLKSKFGEYDELLEKIKRIRNKLLMHNDLIANKDIKVFTSDLGLKYSDIELLFNRLIELLDEVKQDFDAHDITSYIDYFGEVEKKSVYGTEKLMSEVQLKSVKRDVGVIEE